MLWKERKETDIISLAPTPSRAAKKFGSITQLFLRGRDFRHPIALIIGGE